MTIGERIRNRRQELGMTQEELAKRLGYKSKASINKIELGIQDLPQKKIASFASVLLTTPENLMGWAENLEAFQQQLAENKMAADRLYDAYLKADDDTKKIVRMLLHIDGGES